MKTHQDRSARRFGISSRRSIATFAAYALVLTTVTFGALPVTPAAAAPGDGVCYLIADSGGGNGGNDLLTLVDRGDFNAATNETNIGTGTGTYNIEAMDMHPGTLQLYGANADRLGTIDKLTGVFTPLANTFTTTATPARGALGDINITDVDGLAFHYTSNVLYGAERQSGNDLLVQIDIVSGQIVRDAFGVGIDYVSTNVSVVTGGSDDLDDLAFHPTTGVLYGSVTGGNGGHLVTINSSTGAASYIGPYGAGDIEGMRFDAEGYLWGTSGTSPIALYEINITTGAAINPRPLDNGTDYESTVCYVPGSDIWVTKTVSESAPLEGTTVTYTVTVLNAGPANATGVVVEDLLPAGVTYVSSTPSQGSYNDATGVWDVGALLRHQPVGSAVGIATLDIVARADIGSAGSTITNTATRTAVDQGDAVPNNDSASVDIVPVAAADLAVNKVVSDSGPGEGDTFTYDITVVNNGPSTATGVTIGDTLPAGITFISSDPSTGTYTSGSGVWTVGTLSPGALESLEITATVDAGTALSTITNTASVTNSNQPDPDPTNNSASVDINIPVTGVDVTKVADIAGPVSAGDVITYTITVDNTGGLTLNDLVFDDPLPPATSYIAESTVADGVTTISGSDSIEVENTADAAISNSCAAPTTVALGVTSDVSITDVNLGFNATHKRRGHIQLDLVSPAGTSVRLMPGAQTDNDDHYDVLFDAQSSNPLDDGNNDNTGAPYYDRTVGVAGLASFLGESSVGTWTLEICDTDPSREDGDFNQATIYIQGTTLTVLAQTKDNAPDGNPDLIDGTPAALVVAGDDFDLPPGSTMTVTYQVQVDDEFDGSVLSVDNIVAITSDEMATPIEATTSNPIDFNPVVDIVKGGPAGPVGVGDSVTYTYTVDHTTASDGSPVDITVVDDIVDLSAVIPAGDTNSNGLLDRTETWVYTTTYTIPVDAADPLVNVATVSGTDLDGDPIDEATDTHSVDVDFAPLLTVAKVGSPAPASVGDTVTYTYTVVHSAASDLSPVANVSIVDSRGIAISGPVGDGNGNNLLDGSETWAYTATETVTTA
ncbi:MAG: proprotein convertase P-domain-containing protein, partial [Acidimicrobiia bacterium]|nr:proprotein convertase P-domain-containing protein [Acidimicrobiia bacterium]MDX2467457.1 proprotein convertase P-domain-containing protein [Acidimicrobiia bacterium]